MYRRFRGTSRPYTLLIMVCFFVVCNSTPMIIRSVVLTMRHADRQTERQICRRLMTSHWQHLCCPRAETRLLDSYAAQCVIYFSSDATFRTRGPFISSSLCTIVVICLPSTMWPSNTQEGSKLVSKCLVCGVTDRNLNFATAFCFFSVVGTVTVLRVTYCWYLLRDCWLYTLIYMYLLIYKLACIM